MKSRQNTHQDTLWKQKYCFPQIGPRFGSNHNCRLINRSDKTLCNNECMNIRVVHNFQIFHMIIPNWPNNYCTMDICNFYIGTSYINNYKTSWTCSNSSVIFEFSLEFWQESGSNLKLEIWIQILVQILKSWV